jgi:Fur family ferric uptake transcriptional regulator
VSPITAQGKRLHATRQRAAIAEVIAGAAGPLTAEEVWTLARRRLPRIGLRTVFRNLQEQVEEGALARVSFPGQPTSYEKPTPRHHPHFYCLRTGRIFSLDCETPDVRAQCPLPPGFVAVGCEVTIFGYSAGATAGAIGAAGAAGTAGATEPPARQAVRRGRKSPKKP